MRWLHTYNFIHRREMLRFLVIFIFVELTKSDSAIDCNFDSGFCQWARRSTGKLLWNIGNSSVHKEVGDDRDGNFAYVQGLFGGTTEELLESPVVVLDPERQWQIEFSYWKTSYAPILDVCIIESGGYVDCLDSVSGMGNPQWIRRMINMPKVDAPFRVIFRARNLETIDDFIALDDVRLTEAQVDGSQQKPDESIRDYQETLVERDSNQEQTPEKDASEKILIPFGSHFQEKDSQPRFTEFPSITQGMAPAPSASSFLSASNSKKPEQGQTCAAIKCTFLENNSCLWKLDKDWKVSEGNIAYEGVGESSVSTPPFKIPITSFFEFDLWMSDNSQLTVAETMGQSREEAILFARKGMLTNGWHRFRIPLRASPTPVILKILNYLPTEGFVTLANTRLVNENGEEVACESVSEPTRSPLAFENLFLPTNLPGFLPPIQPLRNEPERLTAFQMFMNTSKENSSPKSTTFNPIVIHNSHAHNPFLKKVKMERTHTIIVPSQPSSNIASVESKTESVYSAQNPWSSKIQTIPYNADETRSSIEPRPAKNRIDLGVLNPIRPINADEQQNISQEELVNRFGPLSRDVLNSNHGNLWHNFNEFFGPSAKHKSDRPNPFAKENLDFMFQNAFNG